jgi:hypothetical protein
MGIVSVNRHQGNLLDITPGGSSVKSYSAPKREERVLFTLRFRTLKIELHAVVRGCKVVSLKAQPTYISRLQFVDVSQTVRESLAEFMHDRGSGPADVEADQGRILAARHRHSASDHCRLHAVGEAG